MELGKNFLINMFIWNMIIIFFSRVCTDSATGIHYGIATCEGCKVRYCVVVYLYLSKSYTSYSTYKPFWWKAFLLKYSSCISVLSFINSWKSQDLYLIPFIKRMYPGRALRHFLKEHLALCNWIRDIILFFSGFFQTKYSS